ncbi:MAG TPA: hypothetical protein VE967_06445 [Gemmatimonadaceae bacterium]|nr:hypothetical protein [Gemmatimonadaceae bacterium]
MSRRSLPAIAPEHLSVFLEADLIREAQPGTYYVPLANQHTNVLSGSATFTPMRVALMTGVWLLVLALPIMAWLIAR